MRAVSSCSPLLTREDRGEGTNGGRTDGHPSLPALKPPRGGRRHDKATSCGSMPQESWQAHLALQVEAPAKCDAADDAPVVTGLVDRVDQSGSATTVFSMWPMPSTSTRTTSSYHFV